MHNTNLRPDFYKSKSYDFPSMSKPKIIQCFSVDKKRNYVDGISNLKYLNISTENINFDLNKGYDIVHPKPETDEQITNLLHFIVNNFSKVKNYNKDLNHKILNYDFVCFRGLLRLIMCTPYENRESWSILATKYKGTIYLCAEETKEKTIQKQVETEQSKKFCFYGFKFEQCVLSCDPNIPPDTLSPIYLAEEFCNIYDTILDKKKILYGAEMDGIDNHDKNKVNENIDLNTLDFIELKVKRRETNFRQTNNFHRFKLIKWWCQSFLVGISRVFVGLRNDQGIVNEIEEMLVRDMPKLAEKFWSPAVCMRFLSDFLKTISENISNDNPNIVHMYQWNPQNQTIINRTEFNNEKTKMFLPDWYIKKLNSF